MANETDQRANGPTMDDNNPLAACVRFLVKELLSDEQRVRLVSNQQILKNYPSAISKLREAARVVDQKGRDEIFARIDSLQDEIYRASNET